jgi:hypothetical protein
LVGPSTAVTIAVGAAGRSGWRKSEAASDPVTGGILAQGGGAGEAQQRRSLERGKILSWLAAGASRPFQTFQPCRKESHGIRRVSSDRSKTVGSSHSFCDEAWQD